MRSSVSTDGEIRPRSTRDSMEREMPESTASSPPEVPDATRNARIWLPIRRAESLRVGEATGTRDRRIPAGILKGRAVGKGDTGAEDMADHLCSVYTVDCGAAKRDCLGSCLPLLLSNQNRAPRHARKQFRSSLANASKLSESLPTDPKSSWLLTVSLIAHISHSSSEVWLIRRFGLWARWRMRLTRTLQTFLKATHIP